MPVFTPSKTNFNPSSPRKISAGLRSHPQPLGAKRRDIISQFLVETLVISLTGGLIGIVIGIAIPKIISSLTHVPTVITPLSVILSVCISLLTGIIFGIYPARRAARLDPIDALRQ